MDELHRWASAALSWIDEIYPADIFDGSSGDEGPVRIVEIRENLRQALTTTTPGQGASVPLVSQAEIGDIAIKVDADNGYLARTGDTLVIGMMVAAMWLLQKRYENERATLTERIATLEADLTNALAENIEWLTSRPGSEELFQARLNYKLLTGQEFGGEELIEPGYGSEADNE